MPDRVCVRAGVGQCIARLFNRFEILGTHVRGNKTLGENIADDGCIKAHTHIQGCIMPSPPPTHTHPKFKSTHLAGSVIRYRCTVIMTTLAACV